MNPQTVAALTSLKDFQRQTVDVVCKRLLEDGARRFLVADEVGLGKTLVARGVVARTVDHLQAAGVRRVDIVYVCSNQEIARQNLDRLRLPDRQDVALPSRITLLPLHLQKFADDGVNFVSFTPGTSFEPHSRGGWVRERALMLSMLTKPWGLGRNRGVLNVFRLNASVDALNRELQQIETPHEGIARSFAAAMEDSPLRGRLLDLVAIARRRDLRDSERGERLEVIGQMRRELARVCVAALEPDLVILDEFQRFSELLDGESEAAELADQLFSFENERGEYARVLMLSATPYRAFSRSGDEGPGHHDELHRLLGFLFDDVERATLVREQFNALRTCLLRPDPAVSELSDIRDALETSLREVMVRTERLASSATRNGMLQEVAPSNFALEARDVRDWVELADLRRLLRDRGLLSGGASVDEFWKSSPWPAQFMDGYALKKAILAADQVLGAGPDVELAKALRAVRRQLNWTRFRDYRELAPPNARMRALKADTVDRAWDLLWIPPAMPYHEAGPPFDRPGAASLTKRLVFSSWNVVPRAIAGYLSYEAERRAQRAADPGAVNNLSARKKQDRRLLDFNVRLDEGRTHAASLSSLAWLTPSTALAKLGDVRITAPGQLTGELPSLEAILDATRDGIRSQLGTLEVPRDETRIGEDGRWYWAAPLLLEESEVAARLWNSPDLAQRWSGDQPRGAENFHQHVSEAQAVVRDGISLGQPPSDLVDVLAHLALAGPGNVALRALRGVIEDADETQLVVAACRIAWGLRQLFNAPDATAIVSSSVPGPPYWRQSLQYALRGNLQAVMDEWLHLLSEDAGAGRELSEHVLATVVDRALRVLGLTASRVEVDPVNGKQHVPWRTAFAARYGQVVDGGADQSQHPQDLRRAFNSPFRPFVLASTSVGQEGLDFHTYCHAIVHWNLPTNPVDLEQREGRIHRYKGHAVRRNVSNSHAVRALRTMESNPWEWAFEAARAERPIDQDDLVPYWLYPGPAVIERYVPALPFSRDAERYAHVRRQVTLYRMAFGQPRQEDLIAYLQQQVGQEEAERLAGLVRIDLSPRSSGNT